MKKLSAALLALAPALAFAGAGTWTVDPAHSTVGFSVRHLVISTVRGDFTKFSGKVQLDDGDLIRSAVEANIDVASLDTRVADRDAHLRSPDFFDAAKYPSITFRSTSVVKAGPDRLLVTGDLTMHGVTKPVTLEVSVSPEVKGMYGELRRGFSARGKLDRRDFGLTWNKAIEAGPAVGDEVTLALDVEALKDVPKK